MNQPKLSPEQQRVVHHRDGPLLLVASAGTGKTLVLTERIRYLLEHKTGHYHILALTFTNKAADEMRERLNLDEYDNSVYIGTLHKFCMQTICDRGSIIGFDREPQIFEKVEDRLDILRQAFESDPRLQQILKENCHRNNFLNEVLDAISHQKKKLRTPHYDTALEMSEKSKLFAYLYERYNELLINQNALDFDDILVITYRIFNQFPGITAFYRRLYRYICIDEAQDLNYAQYHLIKSLCGKEFRNLMLVGDPKQAIYGFNGASSDFMLKNFIQDFDVPKENKLELTENYRLSKQIIAAANLLQPSTMQENQAINGEVKALSFPNEDAEADWVINRLQTLIQEGHQDIEGAISWENCAVLGRTRYVVKKLEVKLKQHNIPYYYKRTRDAIESESELIRCFELGMYLLINPQNRLHFQKLLELLNLDNLWEKIDEQSWQDGFEMLTWTANYLQNAEIIQHFKILLTAWQYLIGSEIRFRETMRVLEKYATKTLHDEERAMVCNDIKMWQENWQSYLRQTNSKQHNLSSFITQVALTHQPQHHGLALLTVHSAKGLEFEVVCIMGMCQRTFPDYRAIKNGGKFLEEEEHNAYVALTRSKRLAYLTYPRQKYMPWGEIKPQQASRYLQKMGLEIITIQNEDDNTRHNRQPNPKTH